MFFTVKINNNVAKARREKKENFTKDKKDTYMYNVHKKN